MQFELKKVKTVGGTISNNDGTFTQHVNVTIGVVGCTYEDIKAERTIAYIFSEDLTAKQAEAGIQPFAEQWVADNYPDIQ